MRGPRRRSWGRRLFDMKVDYAVNQIQQLLGGGKTAAR